MKSLMPRVAGLLLLGAPIVTQAADYTFVRGERWQGVTIGGERPRSLPSICRDQQCYTLRSTYSPASRELHKYNIGRVSFDNLLKVPGVERDGERLHLPADIGQPLYREAWRDYLRHHNNDRDD